MKKIISALLIVAPLSLAQAQVQTVADPGWYLGFGLGLSEVADHMTGQDLANITGDALGVTSSFGALTTDEDDTDSSWTLTAGYQFNAVVGLEMYYTDLGEASAVASGTGSAFTNFGQFTGTIASTVEYEAQAFGAAVTVGYPLADRLRLYGKLGAFYYQTDTHTTVHIDGVLNGMPGSGSDTQSDDENGTSILAGVGLGFAFSKDWHLAAEWERYGDLEAATGESDVTVLSASIQHRF